MTRHETAAHVSKNQHELRAVIFDIDGVLLASPHERAWRKALEGYADPDRFTNRDEIAVDQLALGRLWRRPA